MGMSKIVKKTAKPTKPTKTAKPTKPTKTAKPTKATTPTKDSAEKGTAVNVKVSPAFAAKLEATLEVVAKRAKSVFKRLNGPASAEDLEALREMGAPPELQFLLAKHNGSDGPFMRNAALCSVDQLRKARDTMNGLYKANPDRFRNRWDTSWLPFLDAEDGQYYCIDPSAELVKGTKGQILYYDHEVGGERVLQSLDVWLDLVTNLAKKGFLEDEDLDEDHEEKYEEIWLAAKVVGLAQMTDKARGKALEALPKLEDDAEGRRDGVRKLVDEYGADPRLLSELADIEEVFQNWEAVLTAIKRKLDLIPARDRTGHLKPWITALHKTGREAQALKELESAARDARSPEELISVKKITPEFAARAFEAMLATKPKSMVLWLALATVAKGDQRRQAAEQVVALSRENSGAYQFNEGNYAKRAIEAQLILLDELPIGEKPAAFAKFFESQAPALKKAARDHYGEVLVKLAVAAEDWSHLRDGAELRRYSPKTELFDSHVAAAVRAKFELGDEAGALDDLRRTAKKSNPSLRAGLAMMPWAFAPPKFSFMDGEGDELFGPLSPSTRDTKHVAFERKCFEVLAAVQPKEPFWRYGSARCAEGETRLRELRGLLELPAMKTKPTENDVLQLQIRAHVELGDTSEALAILRSAAAKMEVWDAMNLVPYLTSEIDLLAEPVRAWVLDAFWMLGQSHERAFEPLVIVAKCTQDPARREAALKRLVEANPPPKNKLVDHYESHIEALFEASREQEALVALETSLKGTTHDKDGSSRLDQAVPFQSEHYVSTRSREEQEAFLDRWFDIVLPRHPKDYDLWVARAQGLSDPERRRDAIAKAREYLPAAGPSRERALKRIAKLEEGTSATGRRSA